MFSTLNGHVVDWLFLADEEAVHQKEGPGSILSFIPFEESTYSTDPVIRRLEAAVGVGGRGSGTARVEMKGGGWEWGMKR